MPDYRLSPNRQALLADINPSVTTERERLSKTAQRSVSPFLASYLDV